jgi:hypothetical protein
MKPEPPPTEFWKVVLICGIFWVLVIGAILLI